MNNRYHERLKKLRNEKELSQDKLAKELNLITRSSIAKWELQHADPTGRMLILLC